MNEETKKKIAELEAQLSARGAFESAMWGTKTTAGRAFLEIYAQIRELEGEPIALVYPKAA